MYVFCSVLHIVQTASLQLVISQLLKWSSFMFLVMLMKINLWKLSVYGERVLLSQTEADLCIHKMDECLMVASVHNILQVVMVTQISSPYLSFHLHCCLHVFPLCLFNLSGILYLYSSNKEHSCVRVCEKNTWSQKYTIYWCQSVAARPVWRNKNLTSLIEVLTKGCADTRTKDLNTFFCGYYYWKWFNKPTGNLLWH